MEACAPPEMAGGAIDEFTRRWEQAGGTGKPRIVVLSYFSLGEEHTEESLRNLRSYYGFLGDWAEGVAMGAPRTPQAVKDRAAAFEEVQGRPIKKVPALRGRTVLNLPGGALKLEESQAAAAVGQISLARAWQPFKRPLPCSVPRALTCPPSRTRGVSWVSASATSTRSP